MKKQFLFTMLISTLLSLTSCSHIEDSNGPDNYELVSITDDEIINGSRTSISSFKKSWTTEANGIRTSNISTSKFSGVEVLYTKYAKSITYSITSEVKEGNFVVCIINNDKIIAKINANETKTMSFNENDSYYILKIAGESANFTLEYEVKVN